MVSKLVLVVQTFNRPNTLIKCVKSVEQHSSSQEFEARYIVDDHSTKTAGIDYALTCGFSLLHQSEEQLGCSRTLSLSAPKLLQLHPDSLVLYLQNDCIFRRPLPWDVIEYCSSRNDFGILRLYGKYQNQEKKKYRSRSKNGGEDYEWDLFKIGEERVGVRGDIGWASLQPFIAPVPYFCHLVNGISKEAHMYQNYKTDPRSNFRICNNVTDHEMTRSTANGKWGRKVKDRMNKRPEKDTE